RFPGVDKQRQTLGMWITFGIYPLVVGKQMWPDQSIPAVPFGDRHAFADAHNRLCYHWRLRDAAGGDAVGRQWAQPALPHAVVHGLLFAGREDDVRQHAIFPLAAQQAEQFNLCPLDVDVAEADGYEATVP